MIGGLIGQANNSSVINSYSASRISDGNSVGGLVGYAHGGSSCISSFWNQADAGVAVSDCGTEKTREEMKQAITYAGWSTSVWNIVDGSYPTLRNVG